MFGQPSLESAGWRPHVRCRDDEALVDNLYLAGLVRNREVLGRGAERDRLVRGHDNTILASDTDEERHMRSSLAVEDAVDLHIWPLSVDSRDQLRE
jgi:hypothetical protein